MCRESSINSNRKIMPAFSKIFKSLLSGKLDSLSVVEVRPYRDDPKLSVKVVPGTIPNAVFHGDLKTVLRSLTRKFDICDVDYDLNGPCDIYYDRVTLLDLLTYTV